MRRTLLIPLCVSLFLMQACSRSDSFEKQYLPHIGKSPLSPGTVVGLWEGVDVICGTHCFIMLSEGGSGVFLEEGMHFAAEDTIPAEICSWSINEEEKTVSVFLQGDTASPVQSFKGYMIKTNPPTMKLIGQMEHGVVPYIFSMSSRLQELRSEASAQLGAI